MAPSPQRLAELRAMPYEEYRATPEWIAQQKSILSPESRCLICQGSERLGVYHYTLERQGAEQDSDLLILCANCYENTRSTNIPTLPFLHKASVFLGAATISTIGLEGFLQAPLPAEVGALIAAYFLAKNSPALYGAMKRSLPPEVMTWLGTWLGLSKAPDGKRSGLSRWLKTPQPEQAGRKTLANVETPAGRTDKPASSPAENEIDALFRVQREPVSTITLPRLLPNEIIRNTERDSYQICIGRSLTKNGHPPTWINFYKQHLKLIGASQYGKSSMAAAILYLITRTHGPEKVLIALLDLEHKTSRLFADIPHMAAVTINGKQTILHARSRDQVLEYLAYIVAIMEERYRLDDAEVEQEPILLVYLEEFLALKDFYKRNIDRTEGESREQAKKNYAQLVYCISEIARRGLKAKIQFLLCAQVDYRDEDLQEALVNITNGMSFCVLTTAARAAGFTSTSLLNQNAELNEKGVAVVETPDCKDLVHALDFNLEKKLVALARAEQGRNAGKPGGQRSSILGAAQQIPDQEPSIEPQETPALQPQAGGSPAPDQNPNIRKLTYLHQRVLEYYQPGLGYRQLGDLIGTGKDKAGDLIKDLRNWGFLPNEQQP